LKVHHSSDFGGSAQQDVIEEFGGLLENGRLRAGEELVLDHTHRDATSFRVP